MVIDQNSSVTQFGGLAIGFLLDLKWLTRPQRAILGYVFVLTTGFVIWGGVFPLSDSVGLAIPNQLWLRWARVSALG